MNVAQKCPYKNPRLRFLIYHASRRDLYDLTSDEGEMTLKPSPSRVVTPEEKVVIRDSCNDVRLTWLRTGHVLSSLASGYLVMCVISL